jgi:hypothetical protein
MLQPLAALAITVIAASTLSNTPHRTLMVQLIHRCSPRASCLPSQIVARMKTEAERVWCRLDVHLSWIDSRGRAATPDRAGLSVMLEEGAYEGSAPDADSVLAALTQPPDACGWGLAHVWVRHVERHATALVRSAEHALTSLPPALADTFVARALGRALAHEIGHYLLGTREHTSHGLMRPRFAPNDLLEDVNESLYGLASREQAALISCRTSPESDPDSAR